MTRRLPVRFAATMGVLLLPFPGPVPSPAPLAADLPSAAEIIDRAVERRSRVRERGLEEGFTYRMVFTVDELDEDGAVEERRTDVYELIRVEGRPYLTLVERDARPPGEEAMEEERKRREEFAEKVRKGEKLPGEENWVEFDEDLVSRYQARIDHVEEIGGRPAYALTYWPRSGDLPERRRLDRALNRSWGRIWIDVETGEVARLEFTMEETVRFWLFLGSISELRGHLERRPVDGVWLPSHGSMYIDGRIVFHKIRRRQEAAWVDYERREAPLAANATR